jgi:transcriptional/translational regulatory protein YebC/TACO1
MISYLQSPLSMLVAIGSNAESVLYEASGPAGSAFMVRTQVALRSYRVVEYSLCFFPGQIETLTDNKRRTAPALRHILGKHNGSLGTNGSVAWMFDRKGYLEVCIHA